MTATTPPSSIVAIGWRRWLARPVQPCAGRATLAAWRRQDQPMPTVTTPDRCPRCSHRVVVFIDDHHALCQRCGHSWPTPEAPTLGDLSPGDEFTFLVADRRFATRRYRLIRMGKTIAYVLPLPDNVPAAPPVIGMLSQPVRRVAEGDVR